MTANSNSENPTGTSRRAFLGGALGAAALTAMQWTPAFRIPVGSASATIPAPPALPDGLSAYQQAFSNWSGEIKVNPVWTVAPNTDADVVALANWAYANSWMLRAVGHKHNWSPLVLPLGGDGSNTLLLDTTQHLTAVTVNSGSPASVTAQTGVAMEQLLTVLEGAGYGLTATPAPGDVSLGGVLAIDGHGTAIAATGETLEAGHTYGSVSNLIVSLTAVVWNSATSSYVLQTFQRSDPAIAPLMVNLGRTFVTEATLRVGANTRLRCVSTYTTQVTDMFAPPATAGSSSFASYVNGSGRAEAIWFPYTTVPWLKVWSVTPNKPWFSKEVDSPYNYTFADSISSSGQTALNDILNGVATATPTFTNAEMAVVGSGLIVTGTWDIWGWSKNLLLYVRPTTLAVTANGYTILTKRANIQQVVSDFYTKYTSMLNVYNNGQNAGNTSGTKLYPMNGPLEIRVTGLDNPADCGVPGAVDASISALRQRPDHPEWDVAVWLDILTIPGTPGSEQFYQEMEQWVLSNYSGSYAELRPEWSKGWGYNGTSAWSDPTIIGTTIPNKFRAGVPTTNNWDSAVAAFQAYDPHNVFTNSFLDTLLG